MNTRDDIYMRMALEEAHEAFLNDEVPVGAVVVCGDRVIARAHNLTRTLHDITAHAEMQAITAASDFLGAQYLKDCTLYVTLEPCLMCAGAMAWAQIHTLVYAVRDTKRGYSLISHYPILHPRTQIRHGIFADEASRLLVSFFEKKR
ncbi:MAG: nucleoside deaminase [Bacteroidales bacterium]|nr:nucleoside deaminase [Bacteroidales bacterium]